MSFERLVNQILRARQYKSVSFKTNQDEEEKMIYCFRHQLEDYFRDVTPDAYSLLMAECKVDNHHDLYGMICGEVIDRHDRLCQEEEERRWARRQKKQKEWEEKRPENERLFWSKKEVEAPINGGQQPPNA